MAERNIVFRAWQFTLSTYGCYTVQWRKFSTMVLSELQIFCSVIDTYTSRILQSPKKSVYFSEGRSLIILFTIVVTVSLFLLLSHSLSLTLFLSLSEWAYCVHTHNYPSKIKILFHSSLVVSLFPMIDGNVVRYRKEIRRSEDSSPFSMVESYYLGRPLALWGTASLVLWLRHPLRE